MFGRVAAVLIIGGLLAALAACGGSAGQSKPPAAGVCAGDERVPCGDIDPALVGEGQRQLPPPCPAAIGPCLQSPRELVLRRDEVRAIMEAAAQALDREMVVAVTDRRGVVLGVGTNFPFDYAATCAGDCPADATGCPSTVTPASDRRAVDLALQLARTAAFFSADQTPLTSRSIRFISGEHFPPGIRNTGAAALFGIENTNRGCSFDAAENPVEDLIPRARSLCAVLDDRADPPGPVLRCDSLGDADSRCGCTNGIATLPGAVPIYKTATLSSGKPGTAMAGGIGVVLRNAPIVCDPTAAFDSSAVLRLDDQASSDMNSTYAQMEYAARAYAGDHTGFPGVAPHDLQPICAQNGAPACCGPPQKCDFNVLPARTLPFAPVIFIDGIAVPEIARDPPVPAGSGSGISNFIVDPDSLPEDTAQPLPIGWLVPPRASSPGAQPLSAADVDAIITAGYQQASRTRAGIRLPLQARTQMMLAVSDTNDVLLGLFRMNDATVFSIDVAVAKSRNVTWFSNPAVDPLDRMDCPGPGNRAACPFEIDGSCCLERDVFPDRASGTAITNRTISFSSQPYFPSGIEGSLPPYFASPFAPGPLRRAFVYDSANACTNGQEPPNGRQNGIVFFPGSAPLYSDRATLIGGFGVSGDGVEQDDLVTFAGTRANPGFEPVASIRADQILARTNTRLPYLKFNRQPTQ